MQYFITSAPAPGFGSVWRAGRPWPKGGVLVEVVDADEDPRQPEDSNAPRLIGRNTWDQLKGDSRIYARPAGDIEDIAAASVALADARAKIGAIEAENTALKARVAELESFLAAAIAYNSEKSAGAGASAQAAPTAAASPAPTAASAQATGKKK